MKVITLSSGDGCLVDDSDFEFLNKWRWKRHPQGYASRTGYVEGKFKQLLMHRVIMDAPTGMEVHHKNGEKLDNRRENLELIAPRDHRLEHVGILVAIQKARQKYPDEKECVVCGTTFTVNPRKRKRNKCCTPECAQSMRVAAALKARGSK